MPAETAKERIEYLDKCESDRKWITVHHRKVKRSIGIFLVGMFLIGVFGYQLNYGAIGDRLTKNYYSEQKKRLREKLAVSPDDPDLYRELGDLYYSLEDYPGVMAAYEKSLALRLEDAHVLNSLAWFYATCADASLRNPERSLQLAKLAIELDQSAQVYDTLAESYFINGMTAEAVRAGKQALKRAKGDNVYYKKQLERFKKAIIR